MSWAKSSFLGMMLILNGAVVGAETYICAEDISFNIDRNNIIVTMNIPGESPDIVTPIKIDKEVVRWRYTFHPNDEYLSNTVEYELIATGKCLDPNVQECQMSSKCITGPCAIVSSASCYIKSSL